MPKIYKCENCGKKGKYKEFTPYEEIKDIQERLLPGEVVPSAECPKCHALVHQQKITNFVATFYTNSLTENSCDIFDAKENILDEIMIPAENAKEAIGEALKIRSNIPNPEDHTIEIRIVLAKKQKEIMINRYMALKKS